MEEDANIKIAGLLNPFTILSSAHAKLFYFQ
jgi:hypothetical protein